MKIFHYLFPLLLLSHVVLAQSVFTNLSITVVPANTSVVIPQGAVAAGFTTSAISTDFTQPLPVNWLGGCSIAGNGSSMNQSDASGHTWWLGLWWFNGYDNCVIAQKPDPVTNQLVLDMPWVIDSTNFNYGRGIAIETAYQNYGLPGYNGQANTFPINFYVQVIARQTPVLPGSFFAVVTWPTPAIANNTLGGIEDDAIELDTGKLSNSDAAVHNWNVSPAAAQFVWEGQNTPGLPSNFDPVRYTIFGMRATSDGTSREICSYINNVFQSCIPMPGGLTSQEATQRLFLNLQSFCDSWNYNNSCNGNDGQTQHLYVQSVNVWSCPNWQTTQCLSPVLSGKP